MAAVTALSFSPARTGVVVLVVVVFLGAATAAVRAGGGGGGGGGRRGARTALDDVCSDLGGYYVTPAMCASALCGDPSSRCRAARGSPEVAALAARLAAANATAAKASIEAALALAGGGDGTEAASKSAAAGQEQDARRKGMRSCLQLYAGAVPALQWAAQSVAAGRYRGAREVLQAAQYVALGCEGMAGGEAALPRENDQFSLMAIVAHAVVASMLGP